MDLLMISPTNR